MAIIYSNKILLRTTIALILFGLIPTIIDVTLKGASKKAVFQGSGIILGIIISTTLISYIFVYYGRRFEISEKGINFGKRYEGPYIKKEIKIKMFPWTKNKLFLNWSEIKKIHVGIWQRNWAKNKNQQMNPKITKFIHEEDYSLKEIKDPNKNPKRYYFTIETKTSKFYRMGLNDILLNKAKKILKELGRENLIEKETYNL